MKKIITLVLVVALALTSMVSCSINENEVAVIWSNQSDEYLFTVADALDRAFYIENIKYKHYDAKGDAKEQTKLVESAIAGGAPAIVLNPTDGVVAAAAVAKAKEAGIPIILMCADPLTQELVKTYDKAYAVGVDLDSLAGVIGERIAKDLIENLDDYDRNDDGKIAYAATDLVALTFVDAINREIEKSDAEKKPVLTPAIEISLGGGVGGYVEDLFEGFGGVGKNEKLPTKAELLLSANDEDIDDILLAMRGYELNYEKLVTHFIPLYTVGTYANMGALLPENAKEEEKAAYSVLNTIDSGYVSCAALEDDDGMATAVAVILRNLFTGKGALLGVADEYVDGKKILVPYTIYG